IGHRPLFLPHTVKNSQAAPAASSRAYWLKTLHQWHWISSALCLIGMLLFAFTGITLNHAADIPATPVVQTQAAELPQALLDAIAPQEDEPADAPLPPELHAWLSNELGLSLPASAAEWSPE